MKIAALLGPYRNLSTLTAAVLALHPKCEVLNHAADRLLSDPSLDFLAQPGQRTFERFVATARNELISGKQGDYGGSILLSHAYEHADMKALYTSRFGDAITKVDAECLVWKDSMRVQKRLSSSPAGFAAICDALPDQRFILPMRNVLDCAKSNLATGHIAHLGGARSDSVEVAVDRVLEACVWALERMDECPNRVFVIAQQDHPKSAFAGLARFLELDAPSSWLADVSSAFVMRRTYEHNASEIGYAKMVMNQKLARWPAILARYAC